MPSAISAITVNVKPGVRRSERSAYLMSWMSVSMGSLLFVPQRDDGVHAHGARGGQPRGRRRAQGEDQRDEDERRQVVGAHPEQHALHEPGERPGGGEPEPGAD